jgi:hypothetical protein
MTLLTPLPILTLLPILGLTEQQMISRAAAWVAVVRHKMEKNYSREWLKMKLREGLRDGALTLTIKAIKAADAGDEIADAALRQVYAEMVGGALVERGPGHLQIWAFGQRAVLRKPHQRGRGRQWYDDWNRNLGICFLAALACREFNLLPTHNRAARRENRKPSGISIIVAALARNGIHLDESSVQENIWFGLPGELARRAMAERPLQSWLVVQ